MATVHKTVHISRPVDEVWNVVGDIGGIAAWFPGIDASRVEGNQRLCDFEGGFSLEEEIVLSTTPITGTSTASPMVRSPPRITWQRSR